MTKEEAAGIYLDGLMYKNVEIEKFFEAGRALSDDDKLKIQMAIEKYTKDSGLTAVNSDKKIKASEKP